MLQPPHYCLITGADGFIGGVLKNRLRQLGYRVRTHSRAASTDPDHVVLDLTATAYPEQLCQDIDTIFHLAGKAHSLAENKQEAVEYQAVNAEATRKLLVAASQAGVQRFIYFSSVKAMAEEPAQILDETYDLPPNDAYGAAKLQAENYVLTGGFVPHPVVLRPCMVYGPGGKGNLPKMIKAVRRGLFPPLADSGGRRSMVHVEDVVQAALLAASQPQAAGQIYIVTDGQAYGTRQIHNWIRAAFGQPPLKSVCPSIVLMGLAKIGDAIGYCLDKRFIFDSDALNKLTSAARYSSAKIERQLGYQPQFTLEQALPDIIRYLKLN